MRAKLILAAITVALVGCAAGTPGQIIGDPKVVRVKTPEGEVAVAPIPGGWGASDIAYLRWSLIPNAAVQMDRLIAAIEKVSGCKVDRAVVLFETGHVHTTVKDCRK